MQYSGLLTLQVCALANGKCTLVLEMTNFVKCWSELFSSLPKRWCEVILYGCKLFFLSQRLIVLKHAMLITDLVHANMFCLNDLKYYLIPILILPDLQYSSLPQGTLFLGVFTSYCLCLIYCVFRILLFWSSLVWRSVRLAF